MTYECRIESRSALPILGIRLAMAPPEEMSATVGSAYQRLFEYAGAHGAVPTGQVMMIVREMGQPMLLEAAIGLATEVAGEGDVLGSVIPAGNAVVTLHVGRFEDVGGRTKRCSRTPRSNHDSPPARRTRSTSRRRTRSPTRPSSVRRSCYRSCSTPGAAYDRTHGHRN